MNPKNRPICSESQDVIQDMLRSVLGKHFVIALFISEAATGTLHYHLRIDHEPTAVNLEHHDTLKDGFVEDIFSLATQMKSMLERRDTLSRMGGTGHVKLLTWISDDVHPALLKASRRAQRICLDALNREGRGAPSRPLPSLKASMPVNPPDSIPRRSA